MNPKKLCRSQTNRMIGGVCAGIGDYLGIDPTLVRLGVVFTALLGQIGPLVIAYIVLLLVVPEAPLAGTAEVMDAPAPPAAAEPPAAVEPEQPAS